MINRRSNNIKAMVISYKNLGETDRLVTLLSQEFGHIRVVAKGARKIGSNQISSLEPGNLIRALLIQTKSLPILTQTRLVNDTAKIRGQLKTIKQLWQFLEIIKAIFVAEKLEEQLYQQVMAIRQSILIQKKQSLIVNDLADMIAQLGFNRPNLKTQSLSRYVEELTNQKLKSYDYLTIH